ncbi:MAG: hypothetical protein LBD06_07355 [Candidatus Accumulibacter sp.]|jgi:hypothetical protein|nr:hypothetical protein [Accumulibacter sp.]
MNGKRRAEYPHPRASAGAALLIMLLAMTLAFSAFLIASLAESDPDAERRQRTFETLMQAKQALIAWAVVRGDFGADSHHRPGTLPCPDTKFFGDTESGNASGSCSIGGGTSLGRLPWKSLGMDRLRDAHGEMLWYAVSDSFRNPELAKAAINSDTKGTLLLYAADGSTLLTPAGEELSAVIFAPGPPLPGQDREALPDAASSYLDAFDGKNNAKAGGPFIAGPAKDSGGNRVVNDLIVGITARELLSGLEKRALNEAGKALKKYADDNGRYPNPAPFDAPGCTSSIGDVKSAVTPCAGDGVTPTCLGRFPEDLAASGLAPWFSQNGWGRVMIYAIHDSGAGCATFLNVDGKPEKYVLFAPGAARAGQHRPSTALPDYLEDAANTDGWSGDPNFSAPGASSNDQLRAEP